MLTSPAKNSSGKGNDNPLQHSSILAWEILWTEEPGALQSTGLKRVEHNFIYQSRWQARFGLGALYTTGH